MGTSNILEILIQAKNQTGDAIKSASDGFKDMGKNIANVGSSLTMIGAPFAAIGAMAVKSFSDSQKAASQLEAVIKSTGGAAGVTKDAALALADSLQKITPYADDVVVGGENMLLTFTNIGKDTFPRATKAMLDLSTAMGQDLKSSAIQLGKALNDPTAGMTALTRVGVTFTEAQKKQIEAMQKAGDMAGAQAVILAELEREFGGSAEAAGKTFAGSLEILKNKLDNVLEAIGEQIVPVLQQFIGWISKVIDWFNNLSPGVKDFIVKIGMMLASLAAIGPVLIAVGKGMETFGALVGALTSPLGLIMAVVAALGLAFQTNFLGIRDLVEPIIKVFERAWAALQAGQSPLRVLKTIFYNLFPEETAKGINDFIDSLINGFQQAISFVQTQVLPALQKLADWFLTQALPAVIGFVTGTVIPAIQQFFDFLGNAWAVVGPALEKLANWFINDVLPQVVGFIQNTVIPSIQDMFNFIGKVWEIVGPALAKVAEWFIGTALPAIEQFISGTVIPAIGNFIDTLRRIWEAVAPTLLQLLDWFINTGLPAIISFVTTTVIPAVQKFIGILQDIWNAVGPVIGQLVDWFINTGLPAIKNFLEGTIFPVINDLIKILKDIWDAVAPVIAHLVDWFVTTGFPAIKNFIDNTAIPAIQRVIDIIKGIWDFVKGGLDNLKTGIEAVFKWINDNVIQPIIKTIGDIKKALDDITGETSRANQQATAAAQMAPGGILDPTKPIVGSGPSPFGQHDFMGSGQAGMPYAIGPGQMGKEAFIPGDNGTFIPDLKQVIGDLLRQVMGGSGNGLTVNFAGNGPQNQAEANQQADMLLTALRARGVTL